MPSCTLAAAAVPVAVSGEGVALAREGVAITGFTGAASSSMYCMSWSCSPCALDSAIASLYNKNLRETACQIGLTLISASCFVVLLDLTTDLVGGDDVTVMVPPSSRNRRRNTPVSFGLCAVLFACAAGLALSAAGDARAELGDRLAKLSKLRDDVVRGPGPFAYVALRQIWAEWDRGDPSDVDEVLHGLTANAAASAPARAYAGLLEAYARRRRGDLDGARTRLERLGIVSRWSIVGPFDNEGKAG